MMKKNDEPRQKKNSRRAKARTVILTDAQWEALRWHAIESGHVGISALVRVWANECENLMREEEEHE